MTTACLPSALPSMTSRWPWGWVVSFIQKTPFLELMSRFGGVRP
jgi:hypothetical protein